MSEKQYNYFSNEHEWKNYSSGYWAGIGISMQISSREPFEDNLKTKVKWSFKKTENLSRFFRGREIIDIKWNQIKDINVDKCLIVDSNQVWQGQIQAMDEKKFHLQVSSLGKKNIILYSGIVTRVPSWFKLLMFLF